MNQRRKRLNRRFRERVEVVKEEFRRDCDDCFNRSWTCFAQGDEAWLCNNNCESCHNFSRHCNPSSTCPRPDLASAFVRDEFHGRPDLVVRTFHERGRRWGWNHETGNWDLPV